MKLTVLGSSSKGNCYLLDSGDQVLILEAGMKFSEIKKGLNFDLSRVVGCLITHEHQDHCKGAAEMVRAGISVYTMRGTINAMGDNHHNYVQIPRHADVTVIGNFQVKFLDVNHDAAEPVGYMIYHPAMGTLLFITDTTHVTQVFQNVHHVLVECNYDMKILQEKISRGIVDKSFLRNRIISSHMNLDTCKRFLIANDLSKTREIVLIHLSDSNSNAKAFKEDVSGVTGKPVYIADPGLQLDLSLN